MTITQKRNLTNNNNNILELKKKNSNEIDILTQASDIEKNISFTDTIEMGGENAVLKCTGKIM